MPRHHELKIDPGTLDPIISGAKTFDVRRDDRVFQVGDTVLFRETAQSGAFMRETGAAPEYTGKDLYCRVTYVLRSCRGIESGMAVLGLQSLDPRPNAPQKLAISIVEDFVQLCIPSLSPVAMAKLESVVSQLEENNQELRGLERFAPEAISSFHSPGAEAICRERRRQVEEEGYTAVLDAILHPGALNLLAAYYCLHGQKEFMEREFFPDGWNKKWAKREGFPFPSRRDLEKAGALCAAALDRMGEED